MVDLKDLEDGAVQELSGFLSDASVERLGVAKKFNNLLQPLRDLLTICLSASEEMLGIGDLGGHLVLTFSKRVDRQRICHVGIDELLLLTLKTCQPASLVSDQTTAGLCRSV